MFNTKEELSTYIIDGTKKDSLFLVKILRSHSQDKIRNILKLEKDEKTSEAIYKLLHNIETPLCECGKPKKFINVVKGS